MRAAVQWFTALVQAGLETRFLTEQDLLAHATPAVLISSLPKEALAGVFDSAMGSGKMTPETIVVTVTTETLVEHAPPKVIWSCLAAAAERKGLSGAGTISDAEVVTEMLRRSLSAALSLSVITPADVVRQVTPKILMAQFPDALTVKLFEISLSASAMNPVLFVDTLGAEALAKHAPVQVWASLAFAGHAIATGATASNVATGERQVAQPKKPHAEAYEAVSMMVELDDGPKPVIKAVIPEPKPSATKAAKQDQAKS
jgi:hypothetical protein